MSESYGNRTVQVRECRVTGSPLLTFEFYKRSFLFFFLKNNQRVLEADSSGAGRSSNLTAAAEVSDVGTGVPPPNALFLGGPLGVEERSHPLRIQAAALHQVDDCEAVGRSCLHVPDPEIEPLRVLPRVHVSAQAELILVRTAEGGGKAKDSGTKTEQIGDIRTADKLGWQASGWNVHLHGLQEVPALKARLKVER